MPRHSPYALIRLNFPISDYLKSLGSLRSLELLEFHKTFFRLFLLFAVKRLSFCALINFFPPFGEIVFYPTFYRKTYTNLLIFVLFVCSFFLLFNLFSFIRFSMINQVFPTSRLVWLAQVDSNHRPRAYQARALTTWAMRHYGYSSRFPYSYLWWRWWESNPWPPACRAGALPAELHPHRFGPLFQFLYWTLKIEQQVDICFLAVQHYFPRRLFLFLVCFLPICKYEISVSDISHSP